MHFIHLIAGFVSDAVPSTDSSVNPNMTIIVGAMCTLLSDWFRRRDATDVNGDGGRFFVGDRRVYCRKIYDAAYAAVRCC